MASDLPRSRLMSQDKYSPDHIEKLLADVQAAEEAGVFVRTPVSPSALVTPEGSWAKRRRRWTIGLEIAACAALLIGVGSLWSFGNGSGSTSGVGGNPPIELVEAPCANAALLVRCVEGSLGAECRCLDSDDDGDVDLADFGSYQRMFSRQN